LISLSGSIRYNATGRELTGLIPGLIRFVFERDAIVYVRASLFALVQRFPRQFTKFIGTVTGYFGMRIVC
jgi:hypothetical protein